MRSFSFVNNRRKHMKRRIAVVIGSDSDLSQCRSGLLFLKQAQDDGRAEVSGDIHTMSVHRNLPTVLRYLEERNKWNDIDVIIAGAGWAAHLPGVIDAYLGYALGNRRIAVIGVGFEDSEDARHSMAAELSISEVPGTRVIFRDEGGYFLGSDGFLRACQYAVSGEIPDPKEMKPRPTNVRTLDEAIVFAEQSLST